MQLGTQDVPPSGPRSGHKRPKLGVFLRVHACLARLTNLSSFRAAPRPPPPSPSPSFSPFPPAESGTTIVPKRSAQASKNASVETPAAARSASSATPPSPERSTPPAPPAPPAAVLSPKYDSVVVPGVGVVSMALRAMASSRLNSATLERGPAPRRWGTAAPPAAVAAVAAAAVVADPAVPSPSCSPKDALRRSKSSSSRARLVERNICNRTNKTLVSKQTSDKNARCSSHRGMPVVPSGYPGGREWRGGGSKNIL